MEEYPVALSAGGFARSFEYFASIVGELDSGPAGRATHAELEDQLSVHGRELMRVLLQDHLDLRAAREVRAPAVTGSDAVVRRVVECGHDRGLATVFGQVRVTRRAYRAKGVVNVCPADAVLNLPVQKHSHGLRRLAVIEAVTQRTPIGRPVTMDEVTDAALFLLRNGAVNGVNLNVDGGWVFG